MVCTAVFSLFKEYHCQPAFCEPFNTLLSLVVAKGIEIIFYKQSLSARISFGDDMQINKSEKQRLLQAVAELKQKHRELDLAIQEMAEKVHANQLDIGRLKKQKLKLKDSISRLESDLIPNLHA